ncbi:MAG: hypothetical protein R3272_08480 [Candidatus Promineifilaceae bacterium]|nr:hypothetical protein [Candidatus Promineifilaceae bacterium]
MDSLYVFLIRNDIWIYILSALALLWYGSELVRAQSSLRRAMFGLERETALRTRNAALLFILFFGGLIGLVAYVNLQVAPTLPQELLRPPTPTPDPMALPAAPVEERPDAAGTPTSPIPVAPTVTLAGVAADTPTPDAATAEPTAGTPAADDGFSAPSTPVSGCTPAASIQEPQSGDRVPGTLNVTGVADTADFGYYELEISGPQTNNRWADLLGRRIDQPVSDGFLGGNINLSQWSPGTYLLRLKVVNTEGETTNLCVIDIVLD